MSDDARHIPDQPEPNQPEPGDAELARPELAKDDAIEAKAASAAAASDTFEQAGGVDLEPAPRGEASSTSEEAPASQTPARLERLQKILAQAGIASRRHAEELITQGRVQVNGKVVTELGSKADPARDHVRVDGKLLQGSERHRYFMLNKPKGFVTTVSDPEGRPTIMQFFAKMRERLYPIGRLDYMSEGLLLVTNDGELANKLTRAASGVEKTYLVKISGQPSEEDLERLRQGISIDRDQPGSGRVHTAPAQVRRFRSGRGANERQAGRPRTGANPWFEVILVEGRNRELRKMFEEIGHHVEKIRRVGYGPLVLDLEPGKFRELEPQEVEDLRKAADGKYHKPKSREPRQRSAGPQTGRRTEKPQWAQRARGSTEERGRVRRGAGQSSNSERNRAPKHSHSGSRDRFPENRFPAKREDRPARPDRDGRPFGESRERRGSFAEQPPGRDRGDRPQRENRRGRPGQFAKDAGRPKEGNFKRFSSRNPRAGFAGSGEAGSRPPERARFGRSDRKPSGQSKPFPRDREDQPRFGRPRREGDSKPKTDERRGPQTGFRRNRDAGPRFERPRAEGDSRPRTEDRRERRGQSQSGRPAGRSYGSRSGGFPGGKKGTFGAKSGSMRSGGGRRPGSRPGGKSGGRKPGSGKRRP